MRTNRGTIGVDLLLIAGVALALGVVAGGWKPLDVFRKKPPVAELARLQVELDKKTAELEAARLAKEAAQAMERAKQVEQVRYAQQMTAGAVESLSRQPVEHRTPQTALSSDLLRRSEFALGLAIGGLPVDKQAEIMSIVDRALSSVESERLKAREELAAKDRELKVVTAEREAVKAELPKLAAKLDAAEAKAKAAQESVKVTTNEVAKVATKLDQEKRQASSLSAQIDKLWRIALWVAAGYAFLVFVLPGLIKHLDAGWLKSALRDATGYATSPLLYHDAKKKLTDKAALPTP